MDDSFRLHKQHVVRATPEWSAEMDEYRRGDEQRLVGHIRFTKFSPSIFKRFLKEWWIFRSVVTAPIYVSATVDDEKFSRFLSHLGFAPITRADCNDGQQRRIFISLIQDQPNGLQ